MKKLLISLIILFLGVIIAPKKLFTNAYDEPGLITINDLSFFGDGDFKLVRDNEYPYEYFYFYYYFENDNPSAMIHINNVNLDYLYYVSSNDYYIVRVKDNKQVNLNASSSFYDCPDGLYWSLLDSNNEIMNLNTKLKSNIYDLNFNINDKNKMYKLDYYYTSSNFKTYYLFILKDHKLVNISDVLILFNLISTDFRLFKVVNKIDNFNAKISDGSNSYDLIFNPDNYIDIELYDYLLYSLNLNNYNIVNKVHIDSMMIDIIYQIYGYKLFTPSITDYMKMITEIFDSRVKAVYEDNLDIDSLHGLFAIGKNNELFKIYHSEFNKDVNNSKTAFIRTVKFYPYFKYKKDIDINSSYINCNEDYKIVSDNLLIYYGFNPLVDNNQLVAFVDGNQIDISKLSDKELMWLLQSLNENYIADYNSYLLFLSNSINDVSVININKYTDLPNGKGFLKFVKSGKYYDTYFYQSGKYYKYKNLDMINKLNDDLSTYKLRYSKDDQSLIIEFSNNNETFYWDLIKKTWLTEHRIYITGDKKFTSDNSSKLLVYSYIHFNLNISVDKITNIVVNYDTRLIRKYAFFHKTSEWENVTKSINDNNYVENDYSIFNMVRYYERAAKTRLSESITTSTEEGYQWQVLLGYDYYTSSLLDVVGITSSALGIATVQREYKDLAVMEISYWKDGIFYEHVNVDDEYPIDDITKPTSGLIQDVISKLKELTEKVSWIKYVIVGIISLLVIKFISKFNIKRKCKYRR